MVCCPGESSASLVLVSVWVSASLRGYVLRTTWNGVDAVVDEEYDLLGGDENGAILGQHGILYEGKHLFQIPFHGERCQGRIEGLPW